MSSQCVHTTPPPVRVADETWIIALNGDDLFSAGLAAAAAIEWRWIAPPIARATLADSRPRRSLALLAIDDLTAASTHLIRFCADTLDLPIIVFGPASLAAICGSLAAGAEDYIPIPYACEEAVARLDAVLRGRFGTVACAPSSGGRRSGRHLRDVSRHGDDRGSPARGRADVVGER